MHRAKLLGRVRSIQINRRVLTPPKKPAYALSPTRPSHPKALNTLNTPEKTVSRVQDSGFGVQSLRRVVGFRALGRRLVRGLTQA